MSWISSLRINGCSLDPPGTWEVIMCVVTVFFSVPFPRFFFVEFDYLELQYQ